MKRNRNWLGGGLLTLGFTGTLWIAFASHAQAESLCEHPYFPVVNTIQRKYRTTYRTGMPSLTHIERIKDVTDSGFTQELEFATLTFTRPWTCTIDGLANSQPGNLSAELRMKAEKSSGVTLIPLARMTPGAAWERHYDMRGTMPVLEGSEVSGTLDIHFEVIGPGPITVPAGTYETIKISFAQVQNFTLKHQDNESPLRGVLKGTLWYAKDVGLVKTEVEAAAITELEAFTK